MSRSRPPIIALHDVVKEYPSGSTVVRALAGVSMEVRPGEFVAVVGRSGCGKSTLLNMITGIDRPTAGLVRVAGTEISGLPERRMARWRGEHVGVIFQFFQLLPTLSVIENVMLPMDFAGRGSPDERRDRARHLLELVEMADQADKLPLLTSGGQQQRVAIARALANDPPLLVADEPTGNLDSVTAEAVFRLFTTLVEDGKTVVMVTHDRDLAARTRRTIGMVDGRIVSDDGVGGEGRDPGASDRAGTTAPAAALPAG